MSFESEIIQSFLENESIFTEDLRERHSIAPVFEVARERQRLLSKMRISKEDVSAEWDASQELLKELDTKASEEGVLRLPVHLRGEHLEVPKFKTNLAQGVALMTLEEARELSPASLVEYYAQRDVKGIFGGFTMRFIEHEDGSCTPSLAYQVAIGVHETAHSFTNVYATGAVGEAQLGFVADEKMDEVGPLLEDLYDLCGKRLNSLSRLNMALASSEMYDAPVVRRIALDAERVVKAADEEVSQQVEDKLIDLISQYIPPGSRIALGSYSLFTASHDEETEPMYHDMPQDEEIARLEGNCAGFIFRPRPIVKDGVCVGYQNDKALYAVVAGTRQSAYFPLTRVQEFQNK